MHGALSPYASIAREMNEPVRLLPEVDDEIHALWIQEPSSEPRIRDRCLLECARIVMTGQAADITCHGSAADVPY